MSLYGQNPRYWTSLPIAVLSNRMIHPDCYIRLHLAKDCVDNKLFKLIEDITKEDQKIQIQIMEEQPIGALGTIYRMKALWDNDCSITHQRDIDMIPNVQDYKCVEFFRKHNRYYGMGFRSHPYHSIPVLAGMFSFNRAQLWKSGWMPPTFNDYLNFGKMNISSCNNWEWGADQDLLNNFFFYHRDQKHHAKFIDISLPNGVGPVRHMRKVQPTIVHYGSIQLMKMQVKNVQALKVCQDEYGSGRLKFLGMPISQVWNYSNEVKNNLLNNLLNINSNISQILKKRIKDNNINIF